MLKQRLFTALIAIPVVVALALFAPRSAIAMVLGAIVLAGAWEWAAFAGYRTSAAKAVYVALVAAILLLLWWLPAAQGLAGAVIGAGLAWWLLAFFALVLRIRPY